MEEVQLTENLSKKILTELLLQMKYGFKVHEKYKNCDQCDICLEMMNHKCIFETPCHHKFDYECMMVSIVDFGFLKCPKCKTSYSIKNN
jgi:hypothetical protein